MLHHRLEEVALNAWPSLQQVLLDGWVLRFSHGYTKRANSVQPLYGSTLDLEEKLAICEALYRAKSRPCIFRLTPFSRPAELERTGHIPRKQRFKAKAALWELERDRIMMACELPVCAWVREREGERSHIRPEEITRHLEGCSRCTARQEWPFGRSIVLARGFAAALVALLLVACHLQGPADVPATGTEWVGTWGTAPQLVEPANMPPEPGLSGNTLRQVVRVSLGGDRVRARFSNEFGSGPVMLQAVHIAASAGGGAIVPATDRALTFGGNPSVTLESGAAVISDAISFRLEPRSEVALTIHFGATPADLTGHPGSRTTSYLQAGAAVSAVDLSGAIPTERWYIITGIDVLAPTAAAVVALGNSITDGRGSGTNQHNRWPDELARRLQADARTRHVAVLNQGIGGNCVLRDCLGPAALSRFDRDVLEQSGVRWLIVLHGVNDIGQAQGAEAAAVARALIAAYEQMVDRARARGIRVYGATLLPFGGSFYDAPEREAARQTVNAWVRASGRFDAVIDLDAALRDPANPSRLLPVADTGDHLHPNEVGYRMIAEAVDLALFVDGEDRS